MGLPVYWQWDSRLNPEVRVIRVTNVVDPRAHGWGVTAWKSAVKWACDQWARTDVVAFVCEFGPASAYVYPAMAGVIQVSAQDPVVVTPGHDWAGYMNPQVYTQGLINSADVWVSIHNPQDELRYTLAHEFGHILGLDHRPYTAKSCMTSPTRHFGPDAQDLAAIENAYLA